MYSGTLELDDGNGIVEVTARLHQARMCRDLDHIEHVVRQQNKGIDPMRKWHLRGRWRKYHRMTDAGIRDPDHKARQVHADRVLQLFVEHMDFDWVSEKTQAGDQADVCRPCPIAEQEEEEPTIDLHAFYSRRARGNNTNAINPAAWKYILSRTYGLLHRSNELYNAAFGCNDSLDEFFREKVCSICQYLSPDSTVP